MPPQYFRAGAGAVIANSAGLVLVLERLDAPGAWQLPQGGLEADEEPLDGAFREVLEETGIAKEMLELIDRYPEPLAYELPRSRRRKKTGRGQVHYWFLFRLVGTPEKFDLESGGEFRAWKWMPLDQVVRGAVEFRRSVYEHIAHRFGSLLA